MWIAWLLVVFAVSGWLGLRWIVNLRTKYQHTVASISLLLILAVASGYGAWPISGGLAPDWSGLPKFILWFLVSALIFLIFSYGVVQLWCSFLTMEIQQKISALEEEEDKILRQIDYMRWHTDNDYVPNNRDSYETDEVTCKKSFVERWELGGGATRVRSMKVLEWKSEATEMSNEELEEQLVNLEENIAKESDRNKKEQLRVKTYVIELELFERSRDLETEPGESKEVSKPAKGEELRKRLQEVHREVQIQRHIKDEFFRNKITLGRKVGRSQ